MVNVRRLSNYPKIEFPQSIQLKDDLFATFDYLRDERLEHAVQMFTTAAERSDGVGYDEFKDKNDILNKIASGGSYVFIDESNNNIIAVYLLYGSPVSRSENPVHNAGYLIVDPSYRSQGIGEAIMWKTGILAIMCGYKGVLGRTSSIARTIVPLMKTDTSITGVIPRGVKSSPDQFVDDLIVFQKYSADDTSQASKGALKKFNVL